MSHPATQNTIQALVDSLSDFASSTGDQAAQATDELTAFAREQEPLIEALLAEASTGQGTSGESLKLVADAFAGRAASIADDFLAGRREEMTRIVVSTLRGALGVAATMA